MDNIIDPERYGVSFSVKQCRNFDINYQETLNWLINNGWRRFRLMSYWDEHEKEQGVYDFSKLDKQIDMIAEVNGVITLCLGARQPRWPENHWPDWAWQSQKLERDEALLNYIETVVKRYQKNRSIISWQLENEALLYEFGERPEVDRNRLRVEYALIKNLDHNRPIIMSTSTSWGIPLQQPIPDTVGFSFYQIVHSKGKYNKSFHRTWLIKMRAKLIKLLWRKASFIHELQLEPWGPKNIWEMTREEQDKSMNIQQIHKNLSLAKQTYLYPIDMWGGEWWYWRQKAGDDKIWQAVKENIW